METAAFLAELAELIEADKSELTDSYSLAENENWDSLALISVVVMFDEHFHLTVANDELRKCMTIGDLVTLIQKKRELVG